MKRLLAIFISTFLTIAAFGQQISFTAFDTNGPKGECLFEENEDGEIVYSGVVETPFSSETLFGLVREFLYHIEKKYKADISDSFEGITKVACDIELPVGIKFINASWAGIIKKPKATVKFNMVIDIRPGRYRYTLSNFWTDRWRIRGEGKDNGPSNMIHWQRVNSLKKELKRSPNKENSRCKLMIEAEEESYKSEYATVMNFIEDLKTFAVVGDDFYIQEQKRD